MTREAQVSDMYQSFVEEQSNCRRCHAARCKLLVLHPPRVTMAPSSRWLCRSKELYPSLVTSLSVLLLGSVPTTRWNLSEKVAGHDLSFIASNLFWVWFDAHLLKGTKQTKKTPTSPAQSPSLVVLYVILFASVNSVSIYILFASILYANV